MNSIRNWRFFDKKLFYLFPAVSIVLLFFLASCGMEMSWHFIKDDVVVDEEESASLILNIESEFQAQTLLPDVDTTAAHMKLWGAGPTASLSTSSRKIRRLKSFLWNPATGE